LKVKTWWKKACDRNIWGRIIKEAKVYKRLQSQRKKKAVNLPLTSWKKYQVLTLRCLMFRAVFWVVLPCK
jgi:hypothetical protein